MLNRVILMGRLVRDPELRRCLDDIHARGFERTSRHIRIVAALLAAPSLAELARACSERYGCRAVVVVEPLLNLQ